VALVPVGAVVAISGLAVAYWVLTTVGTAVMRSLE
jgi:hypothetical protein